MIYLDPPDLMHHTSLVILCTHPNSFVFSSLPNQIHISLESASPSTEILLTHRPHTRGHPAFTLPFASLPTLQQRLNDFSVSGHPAACGPVNGGSGGAGSFVAPR